MWEAISKLGTNIPALIFLGMLAICLIIMIKNGWISFSNKLLKIGVSGETERLIVTSQFNAIEAIAQDYFEKLPDEFKNDRGNLVIEKIYNTALKWVILNNISDDDMYISIKQDQLRRVIYQATYLPYFRSEEFLKQLDNFVITVVKKLVKIKNYYHKDV